MWGFLRGIGLVIRRQEFSPAHITITVESAKVGAPCPSCGRVSRSRHSSYTRFLMDLPADGRTVNIQLLVRRFRCRNPACRRRVFAERFPQLVRPHARRTERLENLLTRIGVLLGGEAGARLSQDLHVPVSPDTMLRLLYRMELTPVVGLRVVGIDEWAWRKGLRYGTIVCDLEAGRPVELLPEARAESAPRWLAGHPGIEVVSRDRAGVYADAATLGAPRAVQVADICCETWGMWRSECLSAFPFRRFALSRRSLQRNDPWRRSPKSAKPARTPSGGNGSSGGEPSMTRSTTSMQRQSPSGQWLTVWASIAGPCASTSMPLNAHSPNHEADGRAFSTPTATTSWPVGRKAATTRRSCTVRSSSEAIRGREPSSRTLSPRCGVVRQPNLSSAACAWDPGDFADGSPVRRRSLARTNAVFSTWS